MVSTRLSHDLRSALSALFPLNGTTPVDQQKRAHDFLMLMQSKNVRRKFQSIRQSQKDSTDPNNISQSEELSFGLLGSSWLACLELLCQPDAHPAERLFCAQTLSHRIRRVKLSEAIDWEMETSTIVEAAQFTVDKMVHLYLSFIHTIDSNVASKISELIQRIAGELDEEQIKGELSLATLGWVTMQLANLPVTQHTQPLLTTMGATLATLALRLRYTPKSIAQNQPASPLPIVQMVLRSLTESNHSNIAAQELCYCFCLGAIPDTLLGSPGGARGRLSIDPRCLCAAHDELRNPAMGIHLVWERLQSTKNPAFMWTCERWAKFLPLPWEFLEPTLRFAQEFFSQDRLALAYIIAIMESGMLTDQQILSLSMGLSSEQQGHQLSRRRQSSKSKKRQKEKLQEGSTEHRTQQAQQECQHRGLMACQTLTLIWPKLQSLLHHSPSIDIGGEGPLGCLCACASSCLPYVVRFRAGLSGEVIMSVCKTFEEICGHPDREARGLTYEPLFNLHTAVMAVGTVPSDLEAVLIAHMHQCSLRLIPSCAYSPTYFDDMCADNDEELEIERNDVRDVLRAIGGNGGDAYSGPPAKVPWAVLDKILRSCCEALTVQQDQNGLPHETLIHAISALAKPLNHLAEGYARNHLPSPEAVTTLRNAFTGIRLVSEKLCDVLPNRPPSQTLALSRLHCLSTASLAPAFGFVCKKLETESQVDESLWSEMNLALTSAMQAAALSTLHIPELAAASTLGQTQYDIVGAMRSPGGEDHVGVLVFMRLTGEGDELSRHVLRLGHEHNSNLLLSLCNLHDQLKALENRRGPGVHHGGGVCPKTRRILVETITSFVDVSKRSENLVAQEGASAESLLHRLFQSAIDAISLIDTLKLDATAYFKICEVTFDVSSFSSDLVHGLTDERFVSTLMEAGISGFKLLEFTETYDDQILQWGRLRAALTTLVRQSSNPDLPFYIGKLATTLIQAECETIIKQCNEGPFSKSSLFNECVISESTVSAGSLVVAISQVLEVNCKRVDPSASVCIETLMEVRQHVYLALQHECSEPHNDCFLDPRITLCESWFLALNNLAIMEQEKTTSCWTILCETCCVAILLFFYPSLNKDISKRNSDKGMSMDGPHILAMLQFLENCFRLGPQLIDELSNLLEQKLLVEVPGGGKRGAIIAAALLRAASGGLPPWAVEGIPAVFSGLYRGCGDDIRCFERLLQTAMIIRLPTTANQIGGVEPGCLLAGRFFEHLKDTAKQEFLGKTVEVCEPNRPDSWKRFKSVLKHACGGKKKQSGFNLKPSPTCWECDRV